MDDDIKTHEYNRSTRRRTGLFIRMFRVFRDNPDIVALGVVLVCALSLGYFVARIYFGLTSAQIKLELYEFLGFLFTAIATIMASLKKVCTKQGVISSALSKRIEDDHHPNGNSMIPR